jgi:hypothetical protein
MRCGTPKAIKKMCECEIARRGGIDETRWREGLRDCMKSVGLVRLAVVTLEDVSRRLNMACPDMYLEYA